MNLSVSPLFHLSACKVQPHFECRLLNQSEWRQIYQACQSKTMFLLNRELSEQPVVPAGDSGTVHVEVLPPAVAFTAPPAGQCPSSQGTWLLQSG